MSALAEHSLGGSQRTPEEITAKSGSNFAVSFFFLPKNRRQGITHFYALSRVIDDAVDEAPTLAEAKIRLQFWREEIAAMYGGTPRLPVSLAMQQTIREFHIPQRYLELLLEGCEMDLSKQRYANFDELYQYCYRVAGVVGLTSMKIFGLDGELACQAAEELGLALQLTNILRDVRVDAELGRIYLPQDELQKFSLSEAELLGTEVNERRQALLRFQSRRAREYFQKAFSKMQSLPRRPLLAAWIMGRVYERILDLLDASGLAMVGPPPKLSKMAKLRIALRESLKALI